MTCSCPECISNHPELHTPNDRDGNGDRKASSSEKELLRRRQLKLSTTSADRRFLGGSLISSAARVLCPEALSLLNIFSFKTDELHEATTNFLNTIHMGIQWDAETLASARIQYECQLQETRKAYEHLKQHRAIHRCSRIQA